MLDIIRFGMVRDDNISYHICQLGHGGQYVGGGLHISHNAYRFKKKNHTRNKIISINRNNEMGNRIDLINFFIFFLL